MANKEVKMLFALLRLQFFVLKLYTMQRDLHIHVTKTKSETEFLYISPVNAPFQVEPRIS